MCSQNKGFTNPQKINQNTVCATDSNNLVDILSVKTMDLHSPGLSISGHDDGVLSLLKHSCFEYLICLDFVCVNVCVCVFLLGHAI
jgi:hypothetical protein